MWFNIVGNSNIAMGCLEVKWVCCSFSLLFIFFLWLAWNLLCRPGWSQTVCNLSASASSVLGRQASALCLAAAHSLRVVFLLKGSRIFKIQCNTISQFLYCFLASFLSLAPQVCQSSKQEKVFGENCTESFFCCCFCFFVFCILLFFLN